MIRLFLFEVWPLKLWKHLNIWRELAKKRKNSVYKNGDKIAIFDILTFDTHEANGDKIAIFDILTFETHERKNTKVPF